MAKKEEKQMHTSTKVMTWIAGGVLTLTVLAGLVMGLGTLDGGEQVQEAQSSSYSSSQSPF